jgi:putative ABC transport system permease protein
MTAGSCPTRDGQISVSAPMARALRLTLGARLELPIPGAGGPVPTTVVGFYAPFAADDGYWFGRHYLSSQAGIYSVSEGPVTSSTNVADALFGSEEFVEREALNSSLLQLATGTSGAGPSVPIDIPLRVDRIGVDQLSLLQRTVAELRTLTDTTGVTAVTTQLPAVIDRMKAGWAQSRPAIIALCSQLAILALVAFGVAVSGAARNQGRELALSRLRGNGPGRAAAIFIREIGGIVALSLVPGLALGWVVTEGAARWWLVPGVAPEWRWAVLAVALGAGLVTTSVAVIIGRRVVDQPISDLLRDVPSYRKRALVGAVEAAVGTTAAAGLYLSLAGDHSSGPSAFTPALLGALTGLVVGQVAVRLGGAVGQRAFWAGRFWVALAVLTLARRPGYRLTITVLCVAAALVVFAGQQWSVGAANRQQRALAENGATVVLTVDAADARTLLAAVHSADPSGSYASPVVVVQPSSTDAAPLVAVDPSSFERVASWGRADQRPMPGTMAAVAPRGRTAPITLTASSLTLHLHDLHLAPLPAVPRSTVVDLAPNAARAGPVYLGLRLQDTSGRFSTVDYGPLPARATDLDLTGPAECTNGCRIAGLRIDRGPLDTEPISLSAEISGVRVGGAGSLIRLGRATDWTQTPPIAVPVNGDKMVFSDASLGLRITAIDDGNSTSGQHLDVPVALSALYAGAVPPSSDPSGYQIVTSIDGSTAPVHRVADIAFVPGVGAPAVVVDLGTAAMAANGWQGGSQVWLSSDDPAREHRLTQLLAQHHVIATGRTTAADLRRGFARSAPAWGADLGLFVAILSGMIGAAILIMTVTASWRPRVADVGALRLLGVRRRRVRRATIAELSAVVALGVLSGVCVGFVSSRLALPSLPIFTRSATVPLPVQTPIVWTWLAGATCLALVLLGATAVLTGWRVAAAGATAEGDRS